MVDDEPDVAVTLRTGLEGGGFDVDTFTEPLLALKSFKPNYYDLVLIDIVMPKIDGFELYGRLMKIDPDIKRVFLQQANVSQETNLTGQNDHCKSWRSPAVCLHVGLRMCIFDKFFLKDNGRIMSLKLLDRVKGR